MSTITLTFTGVIADDKPLVVAKSHVAVLELADSVTASLQAAGLTDVWHAIGDPSAPKQRKPRTPKAVSEPVAA